MKYGRASPNDPQLVDRDDAGVLELPADLRLLDEAADQVGPMAMLLEQDLDGQVAAEVGIAPLEHGPHRAAGDLAQELHVRGAGRRRGQLGRRRPDHRGLGVAPGVAQQDARGMRRRPIASRASSTVPPG